MVRRVRWHAQDLLASGAVVILENGFWQRPERDEKRLRARELGVAELLRECQGQFDAPTSAELDLFDRPLSLR